MILAICIIITCFGVLGLIAGKHLAIWTHRRRKFQDTFERAKARMERARRGVVDSGREWSEVRADDLRRVGLPESYFKTHAEAKEFKDWVMQDECPGDSPLAWEAIRMRVDNNILDADILEEKE